MNHDEACVKDIKHLRVAGNVYWISTDVAARRNGAHSILLRVGALSAKGSSLLSRTSGRWCVEACLVKEEIVAMLQTRLRHALLAALAGGVMSASLLRAVI